MKLVVFLPLTGHYRLEMTGGFHGITRFPAWKPAALRVVNGGAMAYLDENFLLYSPTARRLFHEVAKDQPIIDYHCHLSPREIATNHRWGNLSEIWLGGDHYKWRLMRANGIDEDLITGDSTPREKFQAWAETVPYTLRNPIHHWTHIELQRYFGIDLLLSPGHRRRDLGAGQCETRRAGFLRPRDPEKIRRPRGRHHR